MRMTFSQLQARLQAPRKTYRVGGIAWTASHDDLELTATVAGETVRIQKTHRQWVLSSPSLRPHRFDLANEAAKWFAAHLQRRA
jgi:hypothetical protein